MSKKQDAFYFDNFIICAEASCQAAYLLKRILENFKPSELSQKLEELHTIEHQADERNHQILDRLTKAFITPIDREDIVTLSHSIDDITDKIEDVLIRIYLNNVQSIQQGALDMLKIVIRCCEEVQKLLREFADFSHSKVLKEQIILINTLEEEADQLFISNMRRLYVGSENPLYIMGWREIYSDLEKCADACEEVADVVERIVMKNS